MLEGDVDAVRVLVEADDRVAEHVLGPVAGALVEDAREIAALDLHLAAHECGGQPDQRCAVRVDDDLLAHPGLVGAHRVDQVHPAQQLHLRAPEVDAVPAGPQLRRALDDGDVEAAPEQPVGECRPGNARTGDQDVHVVPPRSDAG